VSNLQGAAWCNKDGWQNTLWDGFGNENGDRERAYSRRTSLRCAGRRSSARFRSGIEDRNRELRDM
jgi:hypothetical protein